MAKRVAYGTVRPISVLPNYPSRAVSMFCCTLAARKKASLTVLQPNIEVLVMFHYRCFLSNIDLQPNLSMMVTSFRWLATSPAPIPPSSASSSNTAWIFPPIIKPEVLHLPAQRAPFRRGSVTLPRRGALLHVSVSDEQATVGDEPGSSSSSSFEQWKEFFLRNNLADPSRSKTSWDVFQEAAPLHGGPSTKEDDRGPEVGGAALADSSESPAPKSSSSTRTDTDEDTDTSGYNDITGGR